jgi:hypothetical protein
MARQVAVRLTALEPALGLTFDQLTGVRETVLALLIEERATSVTLISSKRAGPERE